MATKLLANPIPIDTTTRKATAINLLNASKPYMRAFHFSWLSFLTAFTGWFAIAPLVPTIKKSLNLNDSDIYDSNIVSVSSTIMFRILVGPLCDRLGPKRVMACLLILGAIPLALTGLVQNATEFITIRFFIGILGACFVPCQFWTTQMFNSNIIGTANALVGGWGNMGAGVTYLLMPLVFDAIHSSGVSENIAWRVALLAPTALCIIVGLAGLIFTDDCPQGNWSRRSAEQVTEVHDANAVEKKDDAAANIVDSEKQEPPMNHTRPSIKTFFIALLNPNVLILMAHYSCSFGIELAVDNAIGLFFLTHFGLKQTLADIIGSIFGFMNLFSRASGGFLSDYANSRLGIRGRLLIQFLMFFLQGTFLVIFRFSLSGLTPAIIVLVIFSFFTQGSCGSTFGIVPFVDPAIVGAVSGLVGAGGNIGGLIFSGLFKVYAKDTPVAFLVSGFLVWGVSLLTLLMKIEGRTLIEITRKK